MWFLTAHGFFNVRSILFFSALKFLRKSVFVDPPEFNVTMGRCGSQVEKLERHFVSRVTCRYMCTKTEDCHHVQYYSDPERTPDDYCQLIGECDEVLPSVNMELHTLINT